MLHLILLGCIIMVLNVLDEITTHIALYKLPVEWRSKEGNPLMAYFLDNDRVLASIVKELTVLGLVALLIYQKDTTYLYGAIGLFSFVVVSNTFGIVATVIRKKKSQSLFGLIVWAIDKVCRQFVPKKGEKKVDLTMKDGMGLMGDEVKAIATIRFNRKKNLTWDRRFTFPAYILLVVTFLVFVASSTTPYEKVYVSQDGASKVVVKVNTDNATKMVLVNGETYKRDYTQGADLVQTVTTIAIMIFGVLALGVYSLWYYKVRNPYITKFVKHWQDTKELME